MTVRRDVRVLVVDDLPEQYEQLREHAEMYHSAYRLSCKLAETCENAFSVAEDWHPSVVLLDAHVFGAQSSSAIERLVHLGAAVVVMTRSRSKEIEDMVLDHGALACIPKSDNPDDLEDLVELLGAVAEDAWTANH